MTMTKCAFLVVCFFLFSSSSSFSALSQLLGCLDSQNSCSREETTESVLGLYSLYYTYQVELNVTFDSLINMDSVSLMFSCKSGEFRLLVMYNHSPQ